MNSRPGIRCLRAPASAGSWSISQVVRRVRSGVVMADPSRLSSLFALLVLDRTGPVLFPATADCRPCAVVPVGAVHASGFLGDYTLRGWGCAGASLILRPCNGVPARVGGACPFASFPQIQCGARPVRIFRNYRYDPLPGRRRPGAPFGKIAGVRARGAWIRNKATAVTLLVIAVFM